MIWIFVIFVIFVETLSCSDCLQLILHHRRKACVAPTQSLHVAPTPVAHRRSASETSVECVPADSENKASIAACTVHIPAPDCLCRWSPAAKQQIAVDWRRLELE